MSMKNSNDIIWNRTRDLLACIAVPQPTAPPRAQIVIVFWIKLPCFLAGAWTVRVLVFDTNRNTVYLTVRSVVGAPRLNTFMQIRILTLYIHLCVRTYVGLPFVASHSASLWQAYITNTITAKAEKINMYFLVEQSFCISVSFLIPFCLLLADGA